MKIYTIKQRESGTGSIHDISSDLYDRDICFPAENKVCGCYGCILRWERIHDL